jgi:hypothetical protein
MVWIAGMMVGAVSGAVTTMATTAPATATAPAPKQLAQERINGVRRHISLLQAELRETTDPKNKAIAAQELVDLFLQQAQILTENDQLIEVTTCYIKAVEGLQQARSVAATYSLAPEGEIRARLNFLQPLAQAQNTVNNMQLRMATSAEDASLRQTCVLGLARDLAQVQAASKLSQNLRGDVPPGVAALLDAVQSNRPLELAQAHLDLAQNKMLAPGSRWLHARAALALYAQSAQADSPAQRTAQDIITRMGSESTSGNIAAAAVLTLPEARFTAEAYPALLAGVAVVPATEKIPPRLPATPETLPPQRQATAVVGFTVPVNVQWVVVLANANPSATIPAETVTVKINGIALKAQKLEPGMVLLVDMKQAEKITSIKIEWSGRGPDMGWRWCAVGPANATATRPK